MIKKNSALIWLSFSVWWMPGVFGRMPPPPPPTHTHQNPLHTFQDIEFSEIPFSLTLNSLSSFSTLCCFPVSFYCDLMIFFFNWPNVLELICLLLHQFVYFINLEVGVVIAQWLQHQRCDQKVMISSPRSGGIIFFSMVYFLCWLILVFILPPCYCSST